MFYYQLPALGAWNWEHLLFKKPARKVPPWLLKHKWAPGVPGLAGRTDPRPEVGASLWDCWGLSGQRRGRSSQLTVPVSSGGKHQVLCLQRETGRKNYPEERKLWGESRLAGLKEEPKVNQSRGHVSDRRVGARGWAWKNGPREKEGRVLGGVQSHKRHSSEHPVVRERESCDRSPVNPERSGNLRWNWWEG